MSCKFAQRRAAGDADWFARLRWKGKGGGSVQDHNCVCSGGLAVTGRGLRGAAVGWYLPVLVADEGQMKRGGDKVMVLMKRVLVGSAAGCKQRIVLLYVSKYGCLTDPSCLHYAQYLCYVIVTPPSNDLPLGLLNASHFQLMRW